MDIAKAKREEVMRNAAVARQVMLLDNVLNMAEHPTRALLMLRSVATKTHYHIRVPGRPCRQDSKLCAQPVSIRLRVRLFTKDQRRMYDLMDVTVLDQKTGIPLTTAPLHIFNYRLGRKPLVAEANRYLLSMNVDDKQLFVDVPGLWIRLSCPIH